VWLSLGKMDDLIKAKLASPSSSEESELSSLESHCLLTCASPPCLFLKNLLFLAYPYVVGLSLPKVLKNTTNHLPSAYY
jgi:hypothetical protein